MKFFLLYYTRNSGYDEETGAPIERNVAAVSKFVADNRPSDGSNLFIREAEAFDGEAEVHAGKHPRGVAIIGSGEQIDRVRKAYEALDVPIADIDIEDDALTDAFSSRDQPKQVHLTDEVITVGMFDGVDFEAMELTDLKAVAHRLGLSFSPQIGVVALAARVQSKVDDLRAIEEGGAPRPPLSATAGTGNATPTDTERLADANG